MVQSHVIFYFHTHCEIYIIQQAKICHFKSYFWSSALLKQTGVQYFHNFLVRLLFIFILVSNICEQKGHKGMNP